MKLSTHIHLVSWLRIRGVIRPLPQSFRGMLLNEVLGLFMIVINYYYYYHHHQYYYYYYKTDCFSIMDTVGLRVPTK
jgi:hypothetical protein